ncbi:MAG: DUF1194 domain-containing protein [Rhodobacterales bacterium]|nr:DUF1194 domain-containing protein [Rhodobacterales bacterium]
MVTRLLHGITVGLVMTGPAAADCRQALVIGMDVSASVDAEDYRLQVNGMAAALEAAELRDLILMQPEAPVRLAIFEWSGPPGFTKLIVPLTDVTTASVLADIADEVREPREREIAASTAIGSALISGLELIRDAGTCWRRTIDLSGDGQSNTGPAPEMVNVPGDVTVNGLVIGGMTEPGDNRLMDIKQLSTYYATNVARGADAFVETALGFADFENAMTRKLIRELQGVPVGLGPMPGTDHQFAELDQ